MAQILYLTGRVTEAWSTCIFCVAGVWEFSSLYVR